MKPGDMVVTRDGPWGGIKPFTSSSKKWVLVGTPLSFNDNELVLVVALPGSESAFGGSRGAFVLAGSRFCWTWVRDACEQASVV